MGKYTYQGVEFASYLAKEHWVMEMNIRNLEWVVRHGTIQDPATKEHLTSTLKRMKQQEKRMRKQLVKDGYML
jgi:hypothetical protein